MEGMLAWKDMVVGANRVRGLVLRSQRYHRNRRLAAGLTDWAMAARLQHKLRLLEICEQTESDPMEIAQAMEVVVDGIIMRQQVRAHELQVAQALTGRISDLKLHAAITMVNSNLVKKVDKPTADMIQRRGMRNWQTVSLSLIHI
eukprot:TRINITY_DN52286_c0_g1_i1.p2 TRINITY_DN52286_c0_g1~~TRINITY_DN52286_c0_g1_i1.p2  ORF type:complete len:145 (-),score=52.48 TRINITY_DN52286_c0_g1_i1:143-577(-)